jgi:hypothetical protein
MVTLEEFDKAQVILGRRGKPRVAKHEFAFTGLMTCGECGAQITAERKHKQLKSGDIAFYIYYRCTWRKKYVTCSQRGVMREEVLIQQIDDELANYEIVPEFRDWALAALRASHETEAAARQKIYGMQQSALASLQGRLDQLIDMRTRDMVTDEEYRRKRTVLVREIAEAKEAVGETEHRAENWLKLTEEVFEFVTAARVQLHEGDLQTKRQVLVGLGANPVILNGKLTITPSRWLRLIAESYPPLEAQFEEVRTNKRMSIKAKTTALKAVRIQWLAVVENVRAAISTAGIES